ASSASANLSKGELPDPLNVFLRNLCANSAAGQDVQWYPASRNRPSVTSESSGNHLPSRARRPRSRPNDAMKGNERSCRAHTALSPLNSDNSRGPEWQQLRQQRIYSTTQQPAWSAGLDRIKSTRSSQISPLCSRC